MSSAVDYQELSGTYHEVLTELVRALGHLGPRLVVRVREAPFTVNLPGVGVGQRLGVVVEAVGEDGAVLKGWRTVPNDRDVAETARSLESELA